MAKVGFHIERTNYFKTLGGVIDELMRRGHEVFLFYNSRTAGILEKGLPLPSPEYFPKFLYGKPVCVPFDGDETLAEAMLGQINILVLHQGYYGKQSSAPLFTKQYQIFRSKGFPVVAIASHFFDACLWPIEAFDLFDKVCVLSRYSVEKHRTILTKLFRGTDEERKKYGQHIDAVYAVKAEITGSALFDMFVPVHGQSLSARKSVILFAPKIDRHPFMQIVMREHSRWVSAVLSVLRYQGRYLLEALTHPKFFEFVKAIRILCEKNGWRLVVKSRPKHGNMHDQLYREHADSYLTGGEDLFYPDFTSADLFRDAVCSLHMRTFSVMEAVIAGTYAVNFEIPIATSRDGFDPLTCEYVKQVRHAQPGGLFNFEGCVQHVLWKDALKVFTEGSCLSLKVDPLKRKKYISDFCGIEDEAVSSASRIAYVIEQTLRRVQS